MTVQSRLISCTTRPRPVTCFKTEDGWNVDTVDYTPEEFDERFEVFQDVANREMLQRRIAQKVKDQRKQLKQLNRTIVALKASYMTLFGEIDRALGNDLPREGSNSYQAGLKEGYKKGWSEGYDIVTSGHKTHGV